MVKISGGKAGSVSRLKKEMAKSTGGKTWIKNVRADEDLTVRFLTEPDDWYAYREHYDPSASFFPCIGRDNDCPGCEHESEKVQRASRRYLANAFDVTAGRSIPLKLPLDLANRLVARYERYGDTITDRDYTLHRMGKGLDTTYDVTPEAQSNFDATRHELVDLEAALIEQFEDAFDLEPSDKGGAHTAPQKKMTRQTPVDNTPDVDEDIPSEPSATAEQGDDDGEYLTEDQAHQMSKQDLQALAEQLNIEFDGRWAKERLIKVIFDSVG